MLDVTDKMFLFTKKRQLTKILSTRVFHVHFVDKSECIC